MTQTQTILDDKNVVDMKQPIDNAKITTQMTSAAEQIKLLREALQFYAAGETYGFRHETQIARDAIAATEAAPVASEPEYGWLVEIAYTDGTPHWWSGRGGDDCWTKNSLDAIRYARKEDAEKVIEYFGWTSPPVIATEHQWG